MSDTEEQRFYGVYKSLRYGSDRGRYSLVIKCSNTEVKCVVDELNFNRGGLFNGASIGCLGTEEYYSYELIYPVYESYQALQDYIKQRKDEARERLAAEEAWRNFK